METLAKDDPEAAWKIVVDAFSNRFWACLKAKVFSASWDMTGKIKKRVPMPVCLSSRRDRPLALFERAAQTLRKISPLVDERGGQLAILNAEVVTGNFRINCPAAWRITSAEFDDCMRNHDLFLTRNGAIRFMLDEQ